MEEQEKKKEEIEKQEENKNEIEITQPETLKK